MDPKISGLTSGLISYLVSSHSSLLKKGVVLFLYELPGPICKNYLGMIYYKIKGRINKILTKIKKGEH